jgi:hypothetical protein
VSERVRVAREAYQATTRANEDGLPWTNPWAAVVAALDTCAPAEGAPTATKTSLHAALTEAVDTIVTGIERSTRPGRDGFLLTSHLQQILDAHPETTLASTRERLAALLASTVQTLDKDEEWYIADVILGQGVIHDAANTEQMATSKDRLALVLLGAWMEHVKARTVASPLDHCMSYADSVLASGLFRSTAEVQAMALREAAADLYGDNGPDHPLSTATWLRARADALHPVPEGSDKA